MNRHRLNRRWLFCIKLLSFLLSWLLQKNLIFLFKIKINVWVNMIWIWFIDDVHWIEIIVKYWIKIIHLNNSLFRFRTICCNMILLMTIKTNVFINIFLFTIIDDMIRKNEKLKRINRLKKEWNELFWCIKTNYFVDFLNFFFLRIFRVILWRLLTRVKYVLIFFNVFKNFKKLSYKICNWKKILSNNAFIIFNWF